MGGQKRFAWSKDGGGAVDLGNGRFEESGAAMAKVSAAENAVAKINQVSEIVGTLVPTVGAIGSMVRLIATAVRPSEAQAAESFDAAIAEFDAKLAGLNDAIAGFDEAKKAAGGI